MKKIVLLLFVFSFFNNCYSQWINVGPYGGTENNKGTYKNDIYITSDNGANCSVSNNGIYYYLPVLSLAKNSNNIIAGTDSTGVYFSTNNGTNWIQRNSGLGSNSQIWSLVSSGTKTYAGTYYDGVYISNNNGLNWAKTGLDTLWITSLFESGSNIIAATETGIFYTSNNGANWISPGLDSIYFFAIAKSGQNLYAGTYNHGLIMSSNNGINWVNSNLNYPVSSLTGSDNSIFAGTCSGYIYRSTNNGLNWINIFNTNNNSILSLVSSGVNVIASSNNNIYVSTNNGDTWTLRNEGLSGTGYIYSLLISNGYVYAGTYGSSVWRRPVTEVIGIKKISTKVPDKYSLFQNYPNPFNPSTIIKYQITSNQIVSLKVYNLLSKEIATLVDEKQSPGIYEVSFDGSVFPSGVYFYVLETPNYKETKKMLMIK
jgi:hypothetical protein